MFILRSLPGEIFNFPSGQRNQIYTLALFEKGFKGNRICCGQEKKGEQLQVPRIMITGISERWQKNAANMPVSQKKGVFYRLILPLAMHANEMVLDGREKMNKMDAVLADGGKLPVEDKGIKS